MRMKITEHTERPEFISLLGQNLGIKFRIFQELRMESKSDEQPQGDIYIFLNEKIHRVLDNEISFDKEDNAVVAVIETKNPRETKLEKHETQLKSYTRQTNCKIGFITNYKTIRYYYFEDSNKPKSEVNKFESLDLLTRYIANKIEENTNIPIGYNSEEIIDYLRTAIDDLLFYTKKVDADVWEHILRLSDEPESEAKKKEMSPKEEEERETFLQRSAAYVGIAQLIFYIVYRNYLIEKHHKDYSYPVLRPLSVTNGIPTQINEMLHSVPDNNLDFKSIFNKNIFSELSDESAHILQGIIRHSEGISAKFVMENDLVGQIFQQLMPFETRKKFAAFYTLPESAELITKLAIKKKDMLVYDPACGSGTLLVNAYKRKRELGSDKHKELLEQIMGSDISDIAAMMSTINLAIQDPSKWTDEVNIFPKDAFEMISGITRYDNHTQYTPEGLREITPRFTPDKNYRVDVLLANPPFTRGSRLTLTTRSMLKQLNMVRQYKIQCDFKRISYYAFFLLIAPALVKKENGTIAFILPIGAINSDIMIPVWRAIFKENFGMKFLIEASDIDESFSDSEDQEVIVILERGYTGDSKLVKLLGKLKLKNISNLVDAIETTNVNTKNIDFKIQIVSQIELQNKPCMEWRINPSNSLLILYSKYVPLKLSELSEEEQQKYSSDLSDNIQIVTENASRPVDYWFVPNKYWNIDSIEDGKITISATSENTVVLSDTSFDRVLELPKQAFIPAMTRNLRDYKNYTPIIPASSVTTYYLIDEKMSNSKIKKYYRWGQEAHKKKMFGESHSSFTPVANDGGILKKLDFSGKILALRFEKSLMGTRIITMGFHGKTSVDSDLFFAYLTSSLFLLDALEKARSRRAEFVIIYLIDFNKIYRFPNIKDLKQRTQLKDKILNASLAYNSQGTINERPSIPDLIKEVRKDKTHKLRKLDEAWLEALGLPTTIVDLLYAEIEERLSDITKKVNNDLEPTIKNEIESVPWQRTGQQKLF